MCLIKKKLTARRNKHITLLEKEYHDTHIFTLQFGRRFIYENKELLKSVIEKFILDAKEKFCSGCYWGICAYDFEEYWLYSQDEISGLEKRLINSSPLISNVLAQDFHILLLLNDIEPQIFPILNNTILPDGTPLLLDIFDVCLTAFCTKDIESVISKISGADAWVGKAYETIHMQKILLDISWKPSVGAKADSLSIKCVPSKKTEVRDSLYNIFKSHGTQLRFIDDVQPY